MPSCKVHWIDAQYLSESSARIYGLKYKIWYTNTQASFERLEIETQIIWNLQHDFYDYTYPIWQLFSDDDQYTLSKCKQTGDWVTFVLFWMIMIYEESSSAIIR